MIRESPEGDVFSRIGVTLYVIVIAAAFLLVAWMVRWLYQSSPVDPLGESRIEERHKNLRELRETADKELHQYAWQDKSRDIVRLPIDRAMELVVLEWRNPAAARSNLIVRIEKATAPAPEKPNPYE